MPDKKTKPVDRILNCIPSKDTHKEFYLTAAQRKIAMYINLGRNLDRWRQWLATEGPILTRLDVDEAWYNARVTNGHLDHYQKPKEPAGHAVALVGYTPDTFIVQNSWGKDWGDEGFGHASLAYAEEAFTEAYGVRL
jgi:C1A family cysteine protease